MNTKIEQLTEEIKRLQREKAKEYQRWYHSEYQKTPEYKAKRKEIYRKSKENV